MKHLSLALLQAQAASPGGGSLIPFLIQIAVVLGILYLLFVRPKMAKNKKHREATANDPAMVNRYRDAYRVGAALVVFGNVIKLVGAVLAAIIVFASVSAAKGPLGDSALLAGFGLAAIAGGLAWVGGVVVTAQGQILRATLDNAVANSPFLGGHERLDAMGLPRSIAERTDGA